MNLCLMMKLKTLKRAICTDFDPNNEDLLVVLYSCKGHNLPTKDNISLLISQLAHQELAQKPRFVSNSMASILNQLKKFSSVHVQIFCHFMRVNGQPQRKLSSYLLELHQMMLNGKHLIT